MRKLFKRLTALLLTAILFLQLSEGFAVLAAEDPLADITLTVPASLQDGENWFFIREESFTVGEKSGEKLYIPIQRTGNAEAEADVTLKVIDMSAHYGVNYTARIRGSGEDPESVYDGAAGIDLFRNADEQEEIKSLNEEDLGQIVYANGGEADWLTPDGELVGRISATPADGEGDPIPEDAGPAPSDAGAADTPTRSLISARNDFTGTVSDRQKLDGGDSFLGGDPASAVAAQQAREQLTDEDVLEDSYPGREFRVHFGAGETVRWLEILPMYSSAADGDSIVMLMLKGLPEDAAVPEDFNMRTVIITDEDPAEPVTVGMAAAEITAQDGKAVVTVTREGRINTVVGVLLTSQDGSAAAGEDYSGVGARLWFPMGVTQRTVELPVGHSAAEKYFTLTLSNLSNQPDVQIAAARCRVVIPAGEAAEETAELMASYPYGEDWNLLNRLNTKANGVSFPDNSSARYQTTEDLCERQYLYLNTGYGYAWDGVHVEYDIFTWYAKARFEIKKYEDGRWKDLHIIDWGDLKEEWMSGQTGDGYYGSLTAPGVIAINDHCYEMHNSFRDSLTQLNVNAVQPIKRSFTVKLVNEALPFEGWAEKDVLDQIQTVMLDDSLETTKTYRTMDNFSVSRSGAVEWARLTGLEAELNGRTLRIGSIDGKTGTVSVQLTEELIDELARNELIEWTQRGSSWSGTITVRPVFEYLKDITVRVRETREGTLYYNGKALPAGTYTFHYGDKLTFTPNVSGNWETLGVRATGVGYESHEDGAAGALLKSGTANFGRDGVTFTLTDDYYEFWQVFSSIDNAVRVRVPASDLQYFDTATGLFAGVQPTVSGDWRIYEIRTGVLTNEFVQLIANPVDETHVPAWTLPNSQKSYSGTEFYFFAGMNATDNLVDLRMDRTAGSHAWYSVSGTAFTSTRNLATGNDANDMIAVEGALFTAPRSGAQSGENGAFTLQPMYLSGGSYLRYTVSFNGTLSIREIRLPSPGSPKVTADALDPQGGYVQIQAVPVTLGSVRLASIDPTAAHFSDVTVQLNGFNANAIHAIEMSGRTLTVTVRVDPGQKYIFDGEEYTEHVTDVTLYFQSQLTGDIHGIYSTTLQEGEEEPGLTWDAGTNTATLTIKKFAPDSPELYTWGDVLMACITTDKRVCGSDGSVMAYQPVSTGYAVISDQDYVPETFDYEVDMESLLQEGLAEDDENTRYSFGKFPWLGEITSVIRTFSYFTGSNANSEAQEILDDLELMEDDGEAQLMGSVTNRWALSAAVAFKETPYGGVRTMIAVAASVGNSTYQKRANPYRSTAEFLDYAMTSVISSAGAGSELIHNKGTGNRFKQKQNYVRSEFGGPYIYFTLYVGIYIDWGYIEVAKTDGSGQTEISHEAVFMGIGGFVGGKLTAGYTQYVFIIAPVYFNLEASVDVTLFIGSEADPNKTLQSFYETTDHKGQDFDLEIEVLGEVGVRLSVGVGFYKVVGVRATGGIGMQVGWSRKMDEWYPDLEGSDTLSFSTDALFSGSIDVAVTSIDLWSASWPLPLGYGWLQFFQQMRRANALIHFINEGINENEGTPAARSECRSRADELGRYVDAYRGTGDELRERVDDLNDYAYDKGIISLTEWRRVNMIRQGGIIGNIMDTVMLTGDEPQNTLFHTRDHVDTRWVAGQDAALQAAFGPVSTATIVENAVSQPAAQIAALGNNRFLVVFLDDDPARDRQQANVLKWTVYDAARETWTLPQVVQNDRTADGRANLTDAGDKLILSWPSIAQDKYDALLAEEAAELGDRASDAAVQAVLEADPARVMALMDVFSVQFDKASETFGPIDQLTDDAYYDDTPQAVYDGATGDYIVLYYKTAQDTEAYADAGERLQDLIGANADPQKTYSVLCYMLYNNQVSAPDTNGVTHSPGWARDYLFPNETDQTPEQQASFLAAWGGQRFLASAIKSEGPNGEIIQSDAPITDLSVCNGYNGLAAFAFTVDKDYNTDTSEDKDLYVQFYRFEDHTVYVPVKVAGEAVKGTVNKPIRGADNVTITPASVTEARQAVDVGQPKLIRNDGSTWLFWREDNDGLRYLNISKLLNAKVATADGGWTYALRADGSFAIDPETGSSYAPEVRTVDFGSAMTDGDLNVTDYQVITDAEDNLYVVWTDIFTYADTDNPLNETVTSPAQAIYATAMIKEPGEAEDDAPVAAWSKPYCLTRDNSSNDGVALALDDDGGLILVHNQYELLLADTQEEIDYMLEHHLAGIYEDEESGRSYFLGYPYYPSEISLMVTRCAPIGSIETTLFSFSDETPEAGQTVEVTAVIENTGLTSAEGCEVEFYEYKNGTQGKLLHTVAGDERFQVNTAKKTSFRWTVPAEGAEGYRIQAIAREKRTDGSFYDPVETFSDEFRLTPEYEPELVSCVQNGDVFDAVYTVTNTGNAAAPQGIRANLCLEGLYGDLKDRYGMDDELLISEDVTGLAPGETRTVRQSFTLPVSVFKFCGYDAVSVVVADEGSKTITATDHSFITLDAPLNLKLNDGKQMTLRAGETAEAALSYDSTVFMDVSGRTLWSVADPAIACVDGEGCVTGLTNGSTTLTATLLPSGRSVEIPVTVSGAAEPVEPTEPIVVTVRFPVTAAEGIENGSVTLGTDRAEPGETVTVTAAPDEGYKLGAVTVTDANGREIAVTDNGDGTCRFTMPYGGATVSASFVKEDEEVPPQPAKTFVDVPDDTWYTEAVDWAVAQGITNGTDETHFSPNVPCTRAQMVTFLWRAAGQPEPTATAMPFTDVASGSWYEKAVLWAIEEGVTKGVSETEFAPNATVTRAQTVTFLYRFAKASAEAKAIFDDVALDAWYAEAVTWAAENEITKGTSETKFSPNDACTRAQIVTFLWRFMSEA